MRALILSADNFEDSELRVPLEWLRREGIAVDVASTRTGPIVGKHGYETTANKTLEQITPDDYDILILPGGKAPSELRRHRAALEIAKSFVENGKPVAAICHGPQILISAYLLHGRRATCYRSVAQELKDAGAIYEDSEVVVDGNLITSRQPSDLPAFMRELKAAMRALEESRRS
jgi:protease I